jgi:methyl-accepting chemotaxis protein
MIQDNPKQIERLNQVKELSQLKQDELAQTISLKKKGQERELRELVLSEKGKKYMDELRSKITEMIDAENSLLAERQEETSRIEQLATWVSISTTLIAITLGGILLLFITRKVVRPLNQVASTIVSSSTEIAATVEQQERTAQDQAAAVNQTTTTMDELGASSRQSTEQAETAAASAQQVMILVDGRGQDNLNSGSSLREKVGDIAEQILRLSEQINQIGTISTLASDLANQTNMLALNAAVEAVRVGEHGKGFGVVAAEIRKLADQSKKSAERINGLVADVQNATNSTVMVTDEGTKTVEKIVSAIINIVMSSQQISLTAKQQAIAIQQVGDAMNALNQGALQTASGINQTKVGTQKLNEAALSLKAIV